MVRPPVGVLVFPPLISLALLTPRLRPRFFVLFFAVFETFAFNVSASSRCSLSLGDEPSSGGGAQE